MKRISRKEAEAEGYTVDTHCYPHIGYKGSRFDPTNIVLVYTPIEERLMCRVEELECELAEAKG